MAVSLIVLAEGVTVVVGWIVLVRGGKTMVAVEVWVTEGTWLCDLLPSLVEQNSSVKNLVLLATAAAEPSERARREGMTTRMMMLWER